MPKVAYSEAQREQIRRDLVAVGLELMTKQGIQHTTVEQIYQKVGISLPQCQVMNSKMGKK